MYTAFIIEPRCHFAFEFVLNNFLENLDEKWNIIIFHGIVNYHFIHDIVDNKLNKYKDRIKLINLKIINLNIKDYNKILCSKEFYDYIPTEIFLIFQMDTLICSKYKNKIYEFFNFDYCGAPWANTLKVGNGGLSLRKKTKMLEIIEKTPNIDLIQEDYYFSNLSNNKPSFELAKFFSIESVYSDITFGIHKPWLYLNKEELNKLFEYFPDTEKLINLNLSYNYNIQKKILLLNKIKKI